MGKKKSNDLVSVLSPLIDMLNTDNVKKTILGTYSDGTIRSVTDAMDGEIFSPKTRAKILRKEEKEKKKNKKKKHKKNRDDIIL